MDNRISEEANGKDRETTWPPAPKGQPLPPQTTPAARWERWCGLASVPLSLVGVSMFYIPLYPLLAAPDGLRAANAVNMALEAALTAVYPVSIVVGVLGRRTWGGKVGLCVSLGIVALGFSRTLVRYVFFSHGLFR